ncbi:MAG: hypothetical protein QOE45_1070 [Frankiaceae bacterium]|jgi:hypothetical protein|nr:hypothetical protein [Frankiaceae bacterium]
MEQVRQAVVIVHGMGEQRPQETLHRFIAAAIPDRADGEPAYYSEPDPITDSFESRIYLARREPAFGGVERHAKTAFYEYHWAHLMQGNRLGDLWPTFRRMLLRPPWRVPSGLRLVWVVFWAFVASLLVFGHPLNVFGGNGVAEAAQRLLGTGLLSTVLIYVITRVLPGPLTNSFVDVVRYLDTSPRSYEVRREIRKGMVDLLRGLHESEKYDRIVVVAHSLGAYIAYDGIAYLWAHAHDLLPNTHVADGAPAGLAEVERLASDLPAEPSPAQVAAYRDAQRALWRGLRAQGSPWLVTDFVSVGTPMYFADDLYTRNRADFDEHVLRREIPTCPPQSDLGDWNKGTTRLWFSWQTANKKRRVLYHGAPFAPVRWTNLWFPAGWGVFGDWFGGPLAPLFGPGIEDVPVTAKDWRRWAPAYAHTRYFSSPRDDRSGSVTTQLRRALDLASTSWLQPDPEPPPPRPRRRRSGTAPS